jgi:hypothetical protein
MVINTDTLQYKVLRELVTEYQQTPTQIIFSKILKRTDKLVLNSIHKHLRRRPELKKINMEDLYHVGIIGLGRALKTTLPTEPGHKITARIVAYIRATIDKEYPNYKKKKWDNLMCFEDDEKIGYIYQFQNVTDDHIFENIDAHFLLEQLSKLLQANEITKEGLSIVFENAVNEKSLTKISKQKKRSFAYIKQRYIQTMEVLREKLGGFE